MSTFAPLDASSAPPTYNVHLSGVLPGLEPAEVAARLAPLFGRPVEQLSDVLSGPGMIVKRGLCKDRARRYLKTLRDAGCVCSAQADEQAVAAPMPQPEPAPPAASVSLAKAEPISLEKAAPDPALQRWVENNPVSTRVDDAARARENEEAEDAHDPSLALMAIGQKLCIDAILLNILARSLSNQLSFAGAVLCVVVLAALSVFGVLRMARGLEFPRVGRVLCAVGALVPLVSVVVMIVLSSMASRRIKDAGFSVGLLGVGSGERELMGGAEPGQPPYSRAPSVAALLLIIAIAMATRISS